MLRRWVAISRASTQKVGGILAWKSNVRMRLFMVCIMHSDLPFCWEVHGHENRKLMPF